MWGTYQRSDLRIEVKASGGDISRCLLHAESLQAWLKPQQIRSVDVDSPLSGELFLGRSFKSSLGPLNIRHEVEMLSDSGVRFLLSEGIDGFHEWQWGDGWVQSRLEGISLVPLSLGQTASIIRLRLYLQQ